MNIAFFEFATNYGGARRSTVEAARRLSQHARVSVLDAYGCCSLFREAAMRSGLQYAVLCPQKARIVGGATSGAIVRIAKLLQALPGLLRVRGRLRRHLVEWGIDVLCCNETKGMAIAESTGVVPVVGFMRGWYRFDQLVPYARYLLRHRLAKLIAVSHATRAALVCGGVDAHKITVLHNPVDAEEIATRAEAPLSAPLPQGNRRLRILIAANLVKAKGIHTAVRALKVLCSSCKDVALYLCGQVPFGADLHYLDELKSMAEELGVSGHIEWLGVRDDVPQLIRASSCVLLPSYSEGLPRILLEAMAIGTPVVASCAGGTVDLVIDGLTGLTFDVGDHVGLARCLELVALQPMITRTYAETARKYVREHFRPETHTSRLIKILEDVRERHMGRRLDCERTVKG